MAPTSVVDPTTVASQSDFGTYTLPIDRSFFREDTYFGTTIWNDFKWGTEMEFSLKCNPDFIASEIAFSPGATCETFGKYCKSFEHDFHLLQATRNSNGIWETLLQCPQCGCGEDGAAKLVNPMYDMYDMY